MSFPIPKPNPSKQHCTAFLSTKRIPFSIPICRNVVSIMHIPVYPLGVGLGCAGHALYMNINNRGLWQHLASSGEVRARQELKSFGSHNGGYQGGTVIEHHIGGLDSAVFPPLWGLDTPSRWKSGQSVCSGVRRFCGVSHTGLDLFCGFSGLLVRSAVFVERELSDGLSRKSVNERRVTLVNQAAVSGAPLPMYSPASVFPPDDWAEELP